jgi:hypothetical protein
MANEFIIKNGFISKGDGQVEGDTSLMGTLEVNGEFREKGTSSLTGAGTITISGGTSIVALRITGTDNVTLPNGNIGQKITIYVNDNSGVNTTIGGSFAGYTNVKLTAIGESVQLLYSASGWIVIGGNNFVTT